MSASRRGKEKKSTSRSGVDGPTDLPRATCLFPGAPSLFATFQFRRQRRDSAAPPRPLDATYANNRHVGRSSRRYISRSDEKDRERRAIDHAKGAGRCLNSDSRGYSLPPLAFDGGKDGKDRNDYLTARISAALANEERRALASLPPRALREPFQKQRQSPALAIVSLRPSLLSPLARARRILRASAAGVSQQSQPPQPGALPSPLSTRFLTIPIISLTFRSNVGAGNAVRLTVLYSKWREKLRL